MAIEPGEALLWKFATNQCSDSEIAYIKSWLSTDPENLKKLQRIQVYLSMNPHETNNTKPDNQEVEEKSSYQNYLRAILILLIVFVLLGIYALIKSK